MRSDFIKGLDQPSLGSSHYSYSNISDSFLDLFEKMGILAVELTRPEIYNPEDININRRSTHIIFKPYDEFRYLHGAINIAHVAWEFEKFSSRFDWKNDDVRHTTPFADYPAMLRGLDQIWVGSQFAADVMKSHGLAQARVVPGPIWPRGLNAEQLVEQRKVRSRYHAAAADTITLKKLNLSGIDVKSEPIKFSKLIGSGRKIFLFVGNHNDLRKNLPALLDGFSLATTVYSEAILVIKFVMDNVYITETHLHNTLPLLYKHMGRFHGEVKYNNIYYTTDILSNRKMQTLYDYSNFYLTASIAEGQNLPLLESMAAGVIPVSGKHTAMNDFIFEENSIILRSDRQQAPQIFERAYGIEGLKIHHIDADDVARGVMQCMSLSEGDLVCRQQNAWRTILKSYSPQVISSLVVDALNG